MQYFILYQQTRMSLSSMIAALRYDPVSPKGTQAGEEYLQLGSHQIAATPGVNYPMGAQDVKNTGCWPWVQFSLSLSCVRLFVTP